MSTPIKADPLFDPIPTSDNVDSSPLGRSKPAPPPAYTDEELKPAAAKPVTTSTNGVSRSNGVSKTNGAAENLKASTLNGPVAENVKSAYNNTLSDFSNLSDSKVKPEERTATGQQLTTYHSFFYNLLTWKSPRATMITFAANIALIFVARYFPLTKWLFKLLALAFGTTVVAELAGKPFGTAGLTSSFRPKKYYVLPRESIEGILSEVHELLNFFVLEFQRILFVENVTVTAAASVTAGIGYLLIKFVPLWGLTLIATSVVYIAPLIYVSNKELIDSQIDHASQVVNSQAAQVKDITAHHAGRASEAARSYASDLSTKASELVGQARGSISGASTGKPTTPPAEFTSKPVAPRVPSAGQPDKFPLHVSGEPAVPPSQFNSKPAAFPVQ